MNDVTIRPLRPEDVPAAVELLAQANASDDRHRLRHRLTSEDHFAIVAERAGTIIGAGKATTEPAFPGTVSALVAVAEGERGRGLGTRLAEPVVERLWAVVDARRQPARCGTTGHRAGGSPSGTASPRPTTAWAGASSWPVEPRSWPPARPSSRVRRGSGSDGSTR